MIGGIERMLGCLTDHFVAVCLFLALFILTWIGVGDVRTVSMLGLLLCAVGAVRPFLQVDLWVFIPFMVYNLISMASSYAAYGNITDGYASTQWIFPVIGLLVTSLDDRERLLVKQLCVTWTGVVAAAGIGQFVGRAVLENSARRVGGFLGNPNAMGIFLTAGWFGLHCCLSHMGERQPRRRRFLLYIEPVLFFGLALTLSMGSFVALAAGILVVLVSETRRSGWQGMVRLACRLLAKASLGVGTGILIYLAAARTGIPWFCLLLVLYALAVVSCWEKFDGFLTAYPGMAALISGFGAAVAAAAVAIRPSSAATFAERLEMMRNGLGYLTRNPLLGVGPYQWRLLNLYDSDKYFNTWHIHNILIHVGVEMGWIAMAMLVVTGVRLYRKNTGIWAKAGWTAFFLHNMMDTSFFYMAIPALVFLMLNDSGTDTRRGGAGAVKVIFGIFVAIFAYNLYYYILQAA